MRIYKYTPTASIKHHSFTLIEMLVVIAIISILASMMMPSLREAQATAIGMSCTSNQKQVVLGLIQYGNDNNSEIPFSKDNSQSGANLAYWTIPLTNYMGLPKESFRTKGTLFYCPGYDQTKTEYNNWYRTYGINSVIMHSDWNMSMANIKKPSKTIIFGDKISSSTDYMYIPYPYSFDADGYTFWAVTGTAKKYGGTPGFWKSTNVKIPQTWRHNDAANFGYIDGHVESSFHEEVATTRGNLPISRWGWFDW